MVSIRQVDGKILHFESIRAYNAWYADVAIYKPRGEQLLARDSKWRVDWKSKDMRRWA